MAQETGFLTGNFSKSAKDIPVKFYLDFNTDGNMDDDEIFVAATDADGKFSIPVFVEKDEDKPTIEPNLTAIQYKEFTHYVDGKGKTTTLTGNYNGQQVNDDDAAWNDLGTIYYKFNPDAAPDQWNDYVQYTSGWFYKEGYNINKTVTGSVKLAKETAFLKGNYQTEANIPVKINVTGIGTLAAPTDANGSFTITVPVKQTNDEPNVTVQNLGMVGAGVGFDYKEFLHYKDATKTEKVEGKYKGLVGFLARGGCLYGPAEAREFFAGLFYRRKLHIPEKHTHAVEKNCAMIREFSGLDRVSPHYRLPVAEVPSRRAEKLLSEVGVAEHPFLAVAPGTRWTTKQWPPEFFAACIERIAALRPDLHFVLLGSPAEAGLCRQVREQLKVSSV